MEPVLQNHVINLSDEKVSPKNGAARKYLAEFVYGATDGTVTTFAIIAGSVGATLSPNIILILGFANLLGDGFSMAASNYLSTKSEIDLGNKNGKAPIKTAWATFLSFVVIGLVPLASFVFASFHPFIDENKFLISTLLTALAFLIIGGIKGVITKKNRFVSAFENFLVGGLAALIAFIVGYILKDFA